MQRIRTFKYSYLFGLSAFLLFSLSLLIGHDEEAANHSYILLKIMLLFASSLLYLLSCNDTSDEQIKRQFAFMSLGVIIYELLLIYATGRTILYIRDYPALIGNFMWLSVGLISFIRFRKSFFDWFSELIKDRERMTLVFSSLITATIVIILSAEPNGIRFTWDSDTLYEFIYDLDYTSLYDAKLLTFHSHVSAVYSHIAVLFKLVFSDIRLAFFLLNSLCIIAASFGTTFLLRSLLPERPIWDYILGNVLFVFSPWVCGLSTYHIYDYYIWCLFPLLAYFLSSRKWIGYWIVGVFITYSKATGLIVFGSVCAGILIMDYVQKLKAGLSFGELLKTLLSNIKYWFFLAVGVVFFLFFKTGIAEDTQFEDTTIGLDLGHISHQIKMYTVSNFNWIFSILALLCIIGVFIVKRFKLSDLAKNTLLVLIISDLLFVLFNCLCITYRIPRYMDSHIAIIYTLGTVFLLCLPAKRLRYCLMIPVIVINFIGGFFSIDPVSKLLFNTINVGDHTVVDYEKAPSPSIGDSIICNREYYSYEILLDKVLSHVINDRKQDDEIMFSLGRSPITWGFSGGRYSYGFNDGKQEFELFYDTDINGLANGYSYDYFDSPNMQIFNMRYIFPEETADDAIDASDSEIIYYIYMPSLNLQKEQALTKYDIIAEEEFDFRGWHMNCIKLKK